MASTTHAGHTPPSRILISRVQDGQGHHHEIWADLEICSRPQQTARLRFQSRWTGARDPDAVRNHNEFYLDATGIDNLRRLLGAK